MILVSTRPTKPRMLLACCLACLVGACPADPASPGDAAGPADQAAPDAAPEGGADADAGAVARCPATSAVSTTDEVLVVGDPGAAMGIFDPSIVYPESATGGAMAYSAVPTQETIRTRIALSDDHGATWTYVAEPNLPEPATIASSDSSECPSGACSGNLISEVSSLVYDADDPDASRRWKLFAHRYLVGPGVALHYRIGTIALQTAPQPQGPWTAPQKLLGWTSPSDHSSSGVTLNVSTLSQTSDCLALTEPGALWLPGVLELALGCVYLDGSTPRIRIELFRSADHAGSWQWVSTPLRPEDAACLTAGASINAAELFAHGGTTYLAATPSDEAGYHGCLIFEIDDIATGRVRRDAKGAAFVARTITPDPPRFAGACAFSGGAGGLAMGVAFIGDARPFRIIRTGIAAP